MDSGQTVGHAWFWIDDENTHGFLYYIAVFPEYRRRGFASAAIAAVEEMVRAAGCMSLGLKQTVGFSADCFPRWRRPRDGR